MGDVHPGLLLYACMSLLLIILILEAAWAGGHQSGMYENLIAEFIGVTAEVGLVYFIITKWINKRDMAKLGAARFILFGRICGQTQTLPLNMLSFLDSYKNLDVERMRSCAETIEALLKRSEQDVAMFSQAITLDVSGHIAMYLHHMGELREVIVGALRDANEQQNEGWQDWPNEDAGNALHVMLHEFMCVCESLQSAIHECPGLAASLPNYELDRLPAWLEANVENAIWRSPADEAGQ